MTGLFLKIVNMGISAGWLILAVMVLRLLFRKAPKWMNPALWGLAGVRLIMPFSIESVFSLIPRTEVIRRDVILEPAPAAEAGGVGMAVKNIVNLAAGDVRPQGSGAGMDQRQIWLLVLMCIWITGMLIMLAYAVNSYWRLSRRIAVSVPVKENIYQCDAAAAPFITGLLHPRIYLPFCLREQDIPSIIAHERAHIERHDHWWKPLGFLLLTVYWFHPLVWAAYGLLCRDIELACDEKVMKRLGDAQRADYAQALLNCSVGPGRITACPLSFGEVGVKERVKAILCYRKPSFWIVLAAVIACGAIAVCFLTSPATPYDSLRLVEHGGPAGKNMVEYELALGNQAMGGAVYAEQWSGGSCVRSAPVALTQYAESIQILVGMRREDEAAVGIDIQIDTDEYGGSQAVYFEFPEESDIRGWLFAAYEMNKEIKIEHGDEVILAAMAFDEGNGVRSLDCERITQEPGILEESDYMIVIRVCFDSETAGGSAEEPVLPPVETADILTEEAGLTGGYDEGMGLGDTVIWENADLDHDGENEIIYVQEKAEGQLYELKVDKTDGTLLWSTEAAVAHTGWNTVLLYQEDGMDYLIQYLPTMFQGMGSYGWSQFSLEGGQPVEVTSMNVEYGLPLRMDSKLRGFAERTNWLLESCTVLLSTEQGELVVGPRAAAELPQLYPVRYDPDDILANMDAGTEDAESFFAEGQPLEFLFASGAGGWGTTLTLHPDGSFEGEYHDSDMGVNAPEYPNGTIYICKFSGRFSEMIRETDHSYSMTLQELTYEETGREWIEDQVRFVAAEPYGMMGEEFILYLPGTPAEQLNEEFLDWWPDAHLWRAGSLDRLTGYGLYNRSTGQGFCTSWLQ